MQLNARQGRGAGMRTSSEIDDSRLQSPLMPNHTDERLAMPRLLAARRRYFDLRAALRCDCELDIDLHAELSAVIRTLDGKIERLFAAGASA